MLRVRLLIVALLILLLAVSVMPLLAQGNDTPPATAFRWDKEAPRNPPFTATPGPMPSVYNLGAALAECSSFDVDEFGRLYVLDGVREELLRFSATGELERSWLDGAHDSIWPMARGGIKVLPGERVFLGPGFALDNIRILGPGPNDDKLLPCSKEGGGNLMPLADGSFYQDAAGKRSETGTLLSSQILHVAPDGTVKSKWECDRIDVMVLAPDGLFYGALYDSSFIEVHDKPGKLVRKISIESIVKEQPDDARVIGVDRNGDIYLLHNRGIYRLDSAGHPLARWYAYRTAEDVNNCVGFGWAMVLKNGLVYAVATRGKARPDPDAPAAILPNHLEIQVFTVSGQCVARYVTTQPPPGMPISVAVLADDKYAVVERASQRAYAIDPSGERRQFSEHTESQVLLAREDEFLLSNNGNLSSYDSQGQLKNKLHVASKGNIGSANMWQVTFDPTNGDLWGLGWAGIITHLKPDGELVKEYPKNMRLCFPTFCTGMAMDRQGFIYVPYPHKHRVEKVDRDGNVVLSIGKERSGVGQLKFPEGMVMDSKDRLYVADSGNSRIQVFDTEGNSLGVYGKRGRGGGEFDRPYGITISPDNTIWVADTFNDRIVRIPMAKFWSEIKTELKPEPVAVAPKPEPEPQAGQVTVTGVVVAGSEDFDDVVYVEDVNRAWGIEVVLPSGKTVKRGAKCRLTGRLSAEARSAKHLEAASISTDQAFAPGESVPAAVGMANLYLGDGYRNTDKKVDLPNLAMLVRSWGRVVSVDRQGKVFFINDGSFPSSGLPVYMDGKRIRPSDWPRIGQYVGVTGISARRFDVDGNARCGIRVRDSGDITLLSE